MRRRLLTFRRLALAALCALPPVAASGQATDSVPQHPTSSGAPIETTGYDLALGLHLGHAIGWSVALGVERYSRRTFRSSTFLLIEPGRRADRVSLGRGTQTGDDLATSIATNLRASYLRFRKPQVRAPLGNYGGLELQVIVLGVGTRFGVFAADARHRPLATIDATLAY